LLKQIKKLVKAYKELASNKDDYEKCKEELRTQNKVDFQKLEELNDSLRLKLIKANEKLIETEQESKANQEYFKKCTNEDKKKFDCLLLKNIEFSELKTLNFSLKREINLNKLNLSKSEEKLISTKQELETNREDYDRCTNERNETFKGMLLRNKNSYDALKVLNVSITEDLNSKKLDLIEANEKLVKANDIINHLKSEVNDINYQSISQRNEITMLKCQGEKDTNTIVYLNTKVIENEQKIEDMSNEMEEVTKRELHSRKLNNEIINKLLASKLEIITKDTELTDLKTKFEITLEEIGNAAVKQREEDLRQVLYSYNNQIDQMKREIQQFADNAINDKEESLRKIRHSFNDRITDINNHHAESLKEREIIFNEEKEMFIEKIDNMNENKKNFISQTRGYIDRKVNTRKYTPWRNKINAAKVIQFLEGYE